MKTSVADPWSNGSEVSNNSEVNGNNVARFEDSFVSEKLDPSRLSDSDQYLARLYSRLKNVKGGTSKKDLINSLSDAKEDCIARLITNGQHFVSEEEAMLAANPVIRHIAPHLQALTASELVHLLKADVLQTVTDEQNGQDESKIETEQLQVEQSQREHAEKKSLGKEQMEQTEIEESVHKESGKSQQSIPENTKSGLDANKCEIDRDCMEHNEKNGEESLQK